MSKLTNLINGDPVYGSTAMEVVAKDPEDRLNVVEHWLGVIGQQIEDYNNPKHYGFKDSALLEAWTYEAWKHATVAFLAAKEMNGRPAKRWDRSIPWDEFLNNI